MKIVWPRLVGRIEFQRPASIAEPEILLRLGLFRAIEHEVVIDPAPHRHVFRVGERCLVAIKLIGGLGEFYLGDRLPRGRYDPQAGARTSLALRRTVSG